MLIRQFTLPPVEIGRISGWQSIQHLFDGQADVGAGLLLLSPADGKNVPFRLLSLPLYMVDQTRRLVREVFGQD